MAVPANAFEEILAHCLAMLDASTGDENADWPITSDDAAYNKLHVTAKIRDAAADVAFAILTADNHPSRTSFLTLSAAMSNGDYLPTSIGAPGPAEVKKNNAASYELAYPRDVQMVKIMREKQNIVRHLYYAVTEADQVFFTGLLDAGPVDNSRIKLWLGVFDVTDPAFYNALSRDLRNWICCRCLMTVQPRGGNVLGGASYWSREWDRFLMSVNKRVLPPEVVMPNQGGTV